MCLLALFPNQPIMLCTGDKNLALMWAGVRASSFAWADGHASFKLSPVEELLPNMTSSERSSFFE